MKKTVKPNTNNLIHSNHSNYQRGANIPTQHSVPKRRHHHHHIKLRRARKLRIARGIQRSNIPPQLSVPEMPGTKAKKTSSK